MKSNFILLYREVLQDYFGFKYSFVKQYITKHSLMVNMVKLIFFYEKKVALQNISVKVKCCLVINGELVYS